MDSPIRELLRSPDFLRLWLVGAFANATWLEYMPWTSKLYREAIAVEDGHIAVPDRPGLGFTFDPDAIERYRVR